MLLQAALNIGHGRAGLYRNLLIVSVDVLRASVSDGIRAAAAAVATVRARRADQNRAVLPHVQHQQSVRTAMVPPERVALPSRNDLCAGDAAVPAAACASARHATLSADPASVDITAFCQRGRVEGRAGGGVLRGASVHLNVVLRPDDHGGALRMRHVSAPVVIRHCVPIGGKRGSRLRALVESELMTLLSCEASKQGKTLCGDASQTCGPKAAFTRMPCGVGAAIREFLTRHSAPAGTDQCFPIVISSPVVLTLAAHATPTRSETYRRCSAGRQRQRRGKAMTHPSSFWRTRRARR